MVFNGYMIGLADLLNSTHLNKYSLVNIMNENNMNDDDNSPNLFQPSPYYTDNELVETLVNRSQSFNLLSLNCQSLNSKFNELQVYLEFYKLHNVVIHCVCLQETWLSDNCDTALLCLQGYNLIAKGKQCSAHGGVAIYLSDRYNYEEIPMIESNLWDGQFIQVSKNDNEQFIREKRKLVIANIYRPPCSNVANIDEFTEDLSRIFYNLRKFKDILITGDFNLDLLKYKDNVHISQYLDNFIANNYIPKITFPTRLTHQHGTLIDNCFMKINNMLHEVKAGILVKNISDHLPIFISFNCFKSVINSIKLVKVFSGGNEAITKFRQFMVDSNVENRLKKDSNADPNDNYEILSRYLSKGINEFFTIKTVRYKKHKTKKSPWITFGIIRSIRYRDKLYTSLKREIINTEAYYIKKTNLKTYNCILRQCIRSAKKGYYYNCFENTKNDIKGTWKNINCLLNRNNDKKDLPKSFLVNGNYISENLEIANNFNQYFTNIGPSLANNIRTSCESTFKDYLNDRHSSNFEFISVTKEQVTKVIDNLKPKTSRGKDNMSNKLLKEVKNEISESLTVIINQCFSTGVFPNSLKIAKVVPLHKKNENYLFDNYRPVSILSSISKVIEKIMHNQIYNYLKESNLLYTSQYGFRSFHSTELATLELVNRITHELDKGLSPISIFLDLSKAFDTIDHSILLYKLRYYGFSASSLNLVKHYLSNRSQYVEYNENSSEDLLITTGVPQGSVLGPLFFIIYMNDLNKVNSSFTPIIYADDTTLLASLNQFHLNSNSISACINNDLSKFSNWLKLNKLSLNCNKTSAMIFRMPKKTVESPAILIDNVPIQFVKEFNFLGIILNENLNWKSHINHISKKVSKVVCILHKLKHFLPKHVLFTIYSSLIVPYLNYGALIWEKNASRLYTLQKKAIRAVTNSNYNAHTSVLFKSLNILKLPDICELHCFTFCYKLENKQLPGYFLSSNLFIKTSEVHNYPSRRNNTFAIPIIHHEYARHGIHYKIVNVFNNMLNQFKEKIYTHSLFGFKSYIKKSIILNYESLCNIENCHICSRN